SGQSRRRARSRRRGSRRAEAGRRWPGTSRSSALHQIDIVDRDRAAVTEEDHEDGKTDRGLRRRDRQHEQRIDLADDVAEMGRERHQVDVDREQNELDRHQDDDDVLAVEENAGDAEREQDGGDAQVMAEADGHVLLPSPCPVLTLTISIAVSGVRAFCTGMLWRLTRTRWCNVSTMAPTMATSSTMPAPSKK